MPTLAPTAIRTARPALSAIGAVLIITVLGAGVATAQTPRVVTAREPYVPEDRVLRVQVRVPLANLLNASDSSRVVEISRVGPDQTDADPTSDPFLDEPKQAAATPDSATPDAQDDPFADAPADPFADNGAASGADSPGVDVPQEAVGSMAPGGVFGALGRSLFGGVREQLPNVSVRGVGPGPMPPAQDVDPFGGPGPGAPGPMDDTDPFGPEPAPPSSEDPFGAAPSPPAGDDPFSGADPFSNPSSDEDPFGGP
ncbi:hypothetical protein Pla175_47680 [Pirellulimonas nuda]|uniref:Uncharacterized protein n=1 Tax=Pirellulimonas nuda TaxID=2528009 RepID=A0A518DIP1_9BACT|nr:hypothetical protein [Pirellulimonas nuda]QDU91347.1 hypothetical protein Pla175_47680 [Pirellulimonas nuda]